MIWFGKRAVGGLTLVLLLWAAYFAVTLGMQAAKTIDRLQHERDVQQELYDKEKKALQEQKDGLERAKRDTEKRLAAESDLKTELQEKQKKLMVTLGNEKARRSAVYAQLTREIAQVGEHAQSLEQQQVSLLSQLGQVKSAQDESSKRLVATNEALEESKRQNEGLQKSLAVQMDGCRNDAQRLLVDLQQAKSDREVCVRQVAGLQQQLDSKEGRLEHGQFDACAATGSGRQRAVRAWRGRGRLAAAGHDGHRGRDDRDHVERRGSGGVGSQ